MFNDDHNVMLLHGDASSMTYLPTIARTGVCDDGLNTAGLVSNNALSIPHDTAATSSDFLRDDEVAQGAGGEDDLWQQFLRALQEDTQQAVLGGDGDGGEDFEGAEAAAAVRRSRRGKSGAAASLLLDDDDDQELDPSFVVDQAILARPQNENMCYHVSEKELEELLEDNELFVRELLDKPDNYAEQYFHHHMGHVYKPESCLADSDNEYLKKLIANLGAMYVQLLTHVYVRFYTASRYAHLKALCLKKLKSFFVHNRLGDPEAAHQACYGTENAQTKSDLLSPYGASLSLACPANLCSAFTAVRLVAQLNRIACGFSAERRNRLLSVTRRLILVMSGVILYPRLAEDRAQQAMLIVWAENWLIAAGHALYFNESRPTSRISVGIMPSMSSTQIARRVQNVLTRHNSQTARSSNAHVNPIVSWKQEQKLPRFTGSLRDKLIVYGDNSPELQPLICMPPNLWPVWLQSLLLSPTSGSSGMNAADDDVDEAAACSEVQSSKTLRRSFIGRYRTRRKNIGTAYAVEPVADHLQTCAAFAWVQEFCTALSQHPKGYKLSMLPLHQDRIYAEFIARQFPGDACLSESSIAETQNDDPVVAASKARYRAFIAEVDQFIRANSDSNYQLYFTYMMLLKNVFIQRTFSMRDINCMLGCIGILRLIAWNDTAGLLTLKLPHSFFAANNSVDDCCALPASEANNISDEAKTKHILRQFSEMLSTTYLKNADTGHRRFTVFLQLCIFLVPATRHIQQFDSFLHQLIVNVRLLLNHVSSSRAVCSFKHNNKKPCTDNNENDAAVRVQGPSHVMSMFTKTLFGEVGLSDLLRQEPFLRDRKLCLLMRKFFPDAEVDDLLLYNVNNNIAVYPKRCTDGKGKIVNDYQSSAALHRTYSNTGESSELHCALSAVHSSEITGRVSCMFVTDDEVTENSEVNSKTSDAAVCTHTLGRNKLSSDFFTSLNYADNDNMTRAERDLVIKYALNASRVVDAANDAAADNKDSEVQRRLHAAARFHMPQPVSLRYMYSPGGAYAANNKQLGVQKDVIYILSDDEAASTSSSAADNGCTDENVTHSDGAVHNRSTQDKHSKHRKKRHRKPKNQATNSPCGSANKENSRDDASPHTTNVSGSE